MDLARTQVLSLFTKAITTALGIAQSIIVVRILSPAEFGLVGLVVSIGGVVGVTQHLGIVDGAIREIAVLKDKREIGKVFWVSHFTRQLVTIPVSLTLLLLSAFVASWYGRPEITSYIQLFAGILILQGLQDVLGATLTGMKKFVALYLVQIATATINIVVFGYLTWQFGIAGFFWAIALTTLLMVILFIAIVRHELTHNLRLPTWQETVHFWRRLMQIGAFMYASRILFVVWQRLPILALGGVLTAHELGYLTVSLTFGSRLAIIAMALSEVNLSWMSSLYVTQRDEFQRVATRNMHRVLILMILLTLLLLFFTPEFLLYIIGVEYSPAQPFILVMTVAFFFYALTDICTSSVFVAANQPRLRAQAYGLLTALPAAIIALLLLRTSDAYLAVWATLVGALAAYILTVVLTFKRFHIAALTGKLSLFLVALFASMLWLLREPSLVWRLLIFFLLVVYTLRETHRSNLMPDLSRFTVGWLHPTKKSSSGMRVICFAGAVYDQISWTNRQHMMSRIAQHFPVLYIEPRIWIVRYIARHIRNPRAIAMFLKRLLWYERKHDHLFIKAQWNLIPGSREFTRIATFNHFLNRWCVIFIAWWLGFFSDQMSAKKRQVMWIYDTEATEYLNAFPGATVLYDCVDDHAVQAGVDRNPQRVREEESRILQRAHLVTVISHRLLELKKQHNPNTHLVLNAGDVDLYLTAQQQMPAALRHVSQPRLGTVGALDSYKVDFQLLKHAALQKPAWNFVLIGGPVVNRVVPEIEELKKFPNVHLLGAIPRRDVPAYVHQFDVCLIPYQDNQYNRASFPLKFWEFMATGKPIVVNGVPELQTYEPFIGYSHSAADFMRLCEEWLEQPLRYRTERIKLAREHSWEQRVDLLSKLLQDTVTKRTYDDRL